MKLTWAGLSTPRPGSKYLDCGSSYSNSVSVNDMPDVGMTAIAIAMGREESKQQAKEAARAKEEANREKNSARKDKVWAQVSPSKLRFLNTDGRHAGVQGY